MSIINQKKQIFGNINTLNVLNDNFPKLPNINSFLSISNSTNSTQFLLDLVNSLVGYESLIEYLVNTITYNLEDIEDLVKDEIKNEITQMVSCSVNPEIPNWLKNEGVTMKVKSVDFFNILKTSPTSESGKLLYAKDLNSDFNYFLYKALQSPGVSQSWGAETIGKNVISVVFNDVSDNPDNNNTFTFKTFKTFDENSTKKLTEFNNSVINSVGLFGSPNTGGPEKIINLVMDSMYGSIKKLLNTSESQIQSELEIKEVIDKIINNDSDEIDDSFFTFDNNTTNRISEESRNIKNGVKIIKTCGNLPVSIPTELLTEIQESIENVSTKVEVKTAVTNGLMKLANSQASQTNNPTDKNTVKTEFFNSLVKTLTTEIASSILKPSFVSIILINNKIIFGELNDKITGIDFIKLNKKIINKLVKTVKSILITALLTLIISQLTKMISKKIVGDKIEKVKNRQKTLASYMNISNLQDQMNKLV